MKIRNGFVSNSSSTSFTFIFKGKAFEDFANLMSNHRNHFNFHCPDAWWVENGYTNIPCSCDYGDIVNSIEVVLNKTDSPDYDKVEILPVDKLIPHLQTLIKENRNDIEQEEKWEKKHGLSHSCELILEGQKLQNKLDKCEQLVKKGYSYISIEFGYNHGHVRGMGLGAIMDYATDVDVNEKDLIVFTGKR